MIKLFTDISVEALSCKIKWENCNQCQVCSTLWKAHLYVAVALLDVGSLSGVPPSVCEDRVEEVGRGWEADWEPGHSRSDVTLLALGGRLSRLLLNTCMVSFYIILYHCTLTLGDITCKTEKISWNINYDTHSLVLCFLSTGHLTHCCSLTLTLKTHCLPPHWVQSWGRCQHGLRRAQAWHSVQVCWCGTWVTPGWPPTGGGH